MQRRIVGFHQDEDRDWVAELECGHQQHVRHDPPWQNRSWVVDPASRAAYVGVELACPLCDVPGGDRAGGLSAYTDARMQGLCEDGAAEIDRCAKARPTVHQLRIDGSELRGA